MKERIKELWRRDIQKLKPDTDYFIITNTDGDVGGMRYSILGSMFVFSKYSSALLATKEFGNDTTVKNIKRDELFERFWEKFDFFELDPQPTSSEAMEEGATCANETSALLVETFIEIFNLKISEKLHNVTQKINEIDKAIKIYDEKFSDLEKSLEKELKRINEHRINNLQKNLENKIQTELDDHKKNIKESLKPMIADAIKDHFSLGTKRSGRLKL